MFSLRISFIIIFSFIFSVNGFSQCPDLTETFSPGNSLPSADPEGYDYCNQDYFAVGIYTPENSSFPEMIQNTLNSKFNSANSIFNNNNFFYISNIFYNYDIDDWDAYSELQAKLKRGSIFVMDSLTLLVGDWSNNVQFWGFGPDNKMISVSVDLENAGEYGSGDTSLTVSSFTSDGLDRFRGIKFGAAWDSITEFQIKINSNLASEIMIDNIIFRECNITATLPTVSTIAANSTTAFTTSSGGEVTSDGGDTVTARGVCWSTSSNPTISDSKTTNDSGTGSFTSLLTSLVANTTYYLRAYATNGQGTSYGSEVSFTTTEIVAGVDWESHAASANNTWNSVCYGNGIFVAVSSDGDGDQVMTSTDGETWTTRSSADMHSWNSICYGNGLFVAVAYETYNGSTNNIMTSTDGINWTLRNSGSDNQWMSVTYGNGVFVAVAKTGAEDRVMTSTDGITWTLRTSASDNNWISVCYGNGKFVAVSNSGSGDRVMTSTDGTSWSSQVSADDKDWKSICYGNGTYVAVAMTGSGEKIMYSTDGENWLSSTPATNNWWSSIVYGDSKFVAVSVEGQVMTSSDGITWIEQTASESNAWTSICYSYGLFVAVSQSGTNRVMVSGNYVLPELASVSTETASNVYATSANSGGNITSDGGDSVTAKGVCWSTSVNPTVSDNLSSDGTGSSSYSSTITGLQPNTTYHYRAYATNSVGTSYGSDLTLTTTALPSELDEWAQITKLVNSDRQSGDNFGYNISMSGDYAVVGAPFNDFDASNGNSMNNAGAAYVLKQTNGIWSQYQKIVSSDRAAADNFGYRVAIDGDYIVVGAWAEDEDASGGNTLGNAGSAYIFKNNSGTWSQIKKIVNSDRVAADNFGISVAISGDYVVVGSHLQDFNEAGNTSVSSAGAAYVFQNNSDTWTQMQKIVASDRSTQDYFGSIVSIDGNYIVVGARQEGTEAFSSNISPTIKSTPLEGAAYVFKNVSGTWAQMQKLTAPTRGATDLFGFAVDIEDDFIVIGAYQEDEDALESNTISNAGSVYIFQNFSDTWRFTQKIVSGNRVTDGLFGRDLTISGSTLIVGSPGDVSDASNGNTLTNAGAAYMFEKINGAWVLTKKIVASDRGVDDNFGYRVATNGTQSLITAYLDDEDADGANSLSNAGSTYAFSLEPIVSSVSVPSSGTYGTGQTLTFTVNFYGNVTVTGVPRIALMIGSSTVYATYSSGSGTSALVFSYTLQSGDTDSDGITVGEMSLNGGTITSSSTSAILTLNNVGSTSTINISSGPSTYVSTTSGAWTSSSTWVSNAVPTSTDYVQINNSHTVTISNNTTITNLILKSGSTLTVTGTAVLTITGYLQDEGGSFSIASGAQVLLMGNIKNASGTNKFVNTSTNGFKIKGNIDVQQ